MAVLAAFVMYVCGTTLFVHTHVVDDTVIVHSHPYSRAAEHSHSSAQLLTIAQLSAALANADIPGAWRLTAPVARRVRRAPVPVAPLRFRVLWSASLRAPPPCVG